MKFEIDDETLARIKAEVVSDAIVEVAATLRRELHTERNLKQMKAEVRNLVVKSLAARLEQRVVDAALNEDTVRRAVVNAEGRINKAVNEAFSSGLSFTINLGSPA